MFKPSLAVFGLLWKLLLCGLSTHAYTHKLVYSQTLVWRPFSFFPFSNWHVSKKKPERVPDSLFSLFFFMSCREGSLLACSSRQGRPLLRKAHSERGWKTPSPYLFLMAISFSSFIYKQNQYVNKKTRFIPQFMFTFICLIWEERWAQSVATVQQGAIHSRLDESPQHWPLIPAGLERQSPAKFGISINVSLVFIGIENMFEWTPKFTIWTYWQHLKM